MSEVKESIVDKLRVKIFETRPGMGAAAAYDISEKLKELLLKKDFVNMIFAAAPSQNEFLAFLSHRQGIDWERVNAFHMDEYVGLEKNARGSFGQFLNERIFGKVPFNKVYYINGNALDLAVECNRYAGLLHQLPPDIVCMGIGENTHIAFNDPHVADFNDLKLVKAVTLDEKSRRQQVHDKCFSGIEEVPVSAITLTVPALLESKYIFCIVPGNTKALAVYHTLYEEVQEGYPSTILRKHINATLYLDNASASIIRLKGDLPSLREYRNNERS
ncbi:MAG: glucosamine-6-phosphate deaminase [Chitinophagaceae bacterium]|nr:glucosamine-6-phosphate deaminase [Chitinophagaceae bacterium]